MAYSNLDKYEMACRQAKVDIGAGVGNALTNAVEFVCRQYCIGDVEGDRSLLEEDLLQKVEELQERFLKASQRLIEASYAEWYEENSPRLKEELGLNPEPVINDVEMPF